MLAGPLETEKRSHGLGPAAFFCFWRIVLKDGKCCNPETVWKEGERSIGNLWHIDAVSKTASLKKQLHHNPLLKKDNTRKDACWRPSGYAFCVQLKVYFVVIKMADYGLHIITVVAAWVLP